MVQSSDKQLGGLYVQSLDGEALTFPLKHTEVMAKIAGNLSRVEVTQIFENPFPKPLEAVYVFPLPDESAVDEMEIKIGDRIIKGNIKKRQEAQEIYQQAKQQGRTAALLEQERDNLFTQSLANILPGEQISVTLRYTDCLKFSAGDYEFVFPMVVGPRYIPGVLIDQSGDTDIVPDASRITTPIVPEGLRSRHEINVTVEITANFSITKIHSPSHQIHITQTPQKSIIALAEGDTIPNKDLILRYQVSGQKTETTVLTQADEKGGHFALYFIPALTYSPQEIIPKDVVFLVDTSGSQSGAPIQKCQELMGALIQGLNPWDTFTIFDFSNTVRSLSPTPLPNTPENRQKALIYINALQACGGTEMLTGIRAAIGVPVPDGRLRSVVLLTDGYIGNENQILAEVKQKLQRGNRLYSFGAGSSVNRFLINRVAEIGRGASYIVRHDEAIANVIRKFFQQVNNPVLSNLEITWEGTGEKPLIYPSPAPDLFAEQPLVLFGRKQDRTSGKLCISGICAGGQRYEKTFNLDFELGGNSAVGQLWARAYIKALTNEMVNLETKVGVEAITEAALSYQLLSDYTAFVAVSDEIRVNPEDESISMNMPVEMPEGVSYQETFGAYFSPVAQSSFGRVTRGIQNSFSTPQIARKQVFFGASSPPSSAEASYDLGCINPGILNSELIELEASKMRLKIDSITGLDSFAALALTEYLKALVQPLAISDSGIVVFEFVVDQGRVKYVIWDDNASTLHNQDIILLLKRFLLKWKSPIMTRQQVRMTMRL